jgi:hypothetical protein
MDQILKDFGNSLSGIFSNELVQLGLKAVGIYIVFLWLATALWAYQDMKSRTSNPLLPYLAAALIIVFTPILFIFAALLYRIIRPHERVGEAHERMLAEEAMLAEVEQIDHCLGCGRRIEEGWLVCPTCRTRLRRVCPNCAKLVGTDWLLCAWCGTDFEVSPARGVAAGAGPYAAPQPASRQAGRAPVRQAAPIAAAAAATERPAPAPERPAPTADRYSMATPAPAPRQEARPPLDDVPSIRDDPRSAASTPTAWSASATDPSADTRSDGLPAAAYARPAPARSPSASPPPDATAPVITSRSRTPRPADVDAAQVDAGVSPGPAPIDPAPASAPAGEAAPTAASSAAPISGRRAAQR